MDEEFKAARLQRLDVAHAACVSKTPERRGSPNASAGLPFDQTIR